VSAAMADWHGIVDLLPSYQALTDGEDLIR
jgi:hypothetical protein